MIKVPLSQGKYAIIDNSDWKVVCKHKWHTKNYKGRLYARTNLHTGRNKWSPLSMHRLIMNAPKGTTVDHINGDGLDNRRVNLRLCTTAQNARNSKKHSRNKSGYKGVHFNRWCSTQKPWVAGITFNGKWQHLGVFSTPEQAAIAYNKKAIELFGEFANLNIVASY